MILERLKEYIDFKGISIAAFEKSIGMSNASFGKSLKNKGAIGTDKLENILSIYTDISPIWLISGVGDMISNTSPAQQSTIEDKLLAIIQDKDTIIREQAEEIGQLRERIEQMERQKEKDASDAHYSNSAMIG